MSPRTYQRRIRKLVALLESIEHIQQRYNGHPECPCCHSYQDSSHSDDCELAIVINAPRAKGALP